MHNKHVLNSVTGSTIILLGAFVFSFVAADGDTPSTFLQMPAYIIGIGIALAMLFEANQGVRNVIRTDWVAILSFYVLTFSEFLFPQPGFDRRVTLVDVENGFQLCLIGFAALSVGRCIAYLFHNPQKPTQIQDMPTAGLGLMFWVCVCFAYLSPMLAVGFDPFLLIEEVTGPRFEVAWQRERLGGWSSLVYELGLLRFAVPVLGAALFNIRDRVGVFHLTLIVVTTFFTLFFAFCSGTRNAFAVQLAGLLGTFLLTHRNLNFWRVAAVGVAAIVVMFLAAQHMLEFRQIGLSTYMQQDSRPNKSIYAESSSNQQELFVDHNMWSISQLRKKFPDDHEFLGAELLWHAITKPIPRALWPGKPTVLSTSIENALGHDDMTIAATFVGESYISFGTPGVIGFGLFLGWICGFWNQVGQFSNNTFGQIVFASGFGAIAICMRSFIFFTTALLPTVALIVFGLILRKYLLQGNRRKGKYSYS